MEYMKKINNLYTLKMKHNKLKFILKKFAPQYQGLDGEFYNSKEDWWFFSRLYTGYGSENILEPNWREINHSKYPVFIQTIAINLLKNLSK